MTEIFDKGVYLPSMEEVKARILALDPKIAPVWELLLNAAGVEADIDWQAVKKHSQKIAHYYLTGDIEQPEIKH